MLQDFAQLDEERIPPAAVYTAEPLIQIKPSKEWGDKSDRIRDLLKDRYPREGHLHTNFKS